MKFKVGDKVKCYVSSHNKSWGHNGIVVKRCSIVYGCVIVRFTGGSTTHVWHTYLELVPIKNQQLEFEFMNES